MLGVFLLGLLTRRKANLTNIPAMLISTGVCLTMSLLGKLRPDILDLAWSWLVVIGTVITFALGLCLGSGDHEAGNRQTKPER